MNAAVGRRLLAEFTGTGLLVAVVVGSGIAATRLTPDGALRLLVNSLVTAFGLAVLILVLIQASGVSRSNRDGRERLVQRFRLPGVRLAGRSRRMRPRRARPRRPDRY